MIKILNKVKKESIKGDYNTAYVSNDPIKIETDYGIQCNNLFTKIRIGSKPTPNAIGIKCSFNSNNTKVKIPTDGLIACYPFDGDIKDHCGSYNGVVHGTEQYDTGIIGQAFKFDGKTSIEFKDNKLAKNIQKTIAFWIKFFDNESRQILVNVQQEDPGWTNFEIILENQKIKIGGRNDNHNNINYKIIYISNENILKNKWYFIVLTKNNDTYYLYINNKLNGNFKYNFYEFSNSFRQVLGCFKNASNDSQNRDYFNGLMDQVRIYNRFLTEEEINALYNEGNTQNTNFLNNLDPFGDKSQVAYYPFDGNAKDIVGGNDGIWDKSEAYVKGKIGQAAKFNGDNRIFVQKQITNSKVFSVSLWFKNLTCDTNMPYPRAGLFYFYKDKNNVKHNDYGIGITPDNYIMLRTLNKDDSKNINDIKIVKVDGLYNSNKWNQLVAVTDYNTKEIKIYVNSKLVYEGKDLRVNGWENPCYLTQIGADQRNSIGYIDDFRIFDRALTKEEIQTLYIGEQINTPISNNQTFGIWIYNDYLNVKQEILTNPEIIEPTFPITEKFDKYTVAYCSRSGTQDCKLTFKAKNLIPGKKYKLLFGVGAFASIDEYSNNSNVSNDYFEITINNQTYKYYRKRPADLILLNTNKKILTGTIISKVLNEQNTEYNNLTSIFENIPLEFIASNSDENIILHFVADENFNNERWAYIVGSMKIIEE